MLSGTTCNAAVMVGNAVLRIVVSSASMKNATAASQGSTRRMFGGAWARVIRAGSLVPRLGCALRISAAPSGEGRRNPSARQTRPRYSICLDVRQPGTEFRAVVLAHASMVDTFARV